MKTNATQLEFSDNFAEQFGGGLSINSEHKGFAWSEIISTNSSLDKRRNCYFNSSDCCVSKFSTEYTSKHSKPFRGLL